MLHPYFEPDVLAQVEELNRLQILHRETGDADSDQDYLEQELASLPPAVSNADIVYALDNLARCWQDMRDAQERQTRLLERVIEILGERT